MGKVMDLPKQERPREKALRYGVKSLANRELLALLIRTGVKKQSALETAECLLQQSQGLPNLARMTIKEMIQVKGISQVKAMELQACFELTRRITYEQALHQDVIENPQAMLRWLHHEVGPLLQEVFLAVYVDASHCILNHRILFQGTINCAAVYPREIFKEALLLSASGIFLVHNHPSGNCQPSPADIQLTEQLMVSSHFLKIPILDHFIVSESGYFSFKEAGIMLE